MVPDQDEQPANDDLIPEAPEDRLPDQQEPSADGPPPAEDHATEDQPQDAHPAEDQQQDAHPAEDQPQDAHPAEDTQTQQLPVAASTTTEPAPSQPGQPRPTRPASPTRPNASAAPRPAPATADLQREVTVVPGVPRYHNPHCLLIRFMGQDDLDQMTLDAARQAGCTPCRACLPDQPEANPE